MTTAPSKRLPAVARFLTLWIFLAMAVGATLGTVLAFMMSVIGISAPELIILRKVLRPKLIAVFVGVVTVGIMLVGFLFNVIM